MKRVITTSTEVFTYNELALSGRKRVLASQAKYFEESGAFYEILEHKPVELLEDLGYSNVEVQAWNVEYNCTKGNIKHYWNERYNMLEFTSDDFEGSSEGHPEAVKDAQEVMETLHDELDYFYSDEGLVESLDFYGRYTKNGVFVSGDEELRYSSVWEEAAYSHFFASEENLYGKIYSDVEYRAVAEKIVGDVPNKEAAEKAVAEIMSFLPEARSYYSNSNLHVANRK